MKYTYFLLLYFALSVVEIAGEMLGMRWLIFATKPVLVPVLAAGFWISTAATGEKKYRWCILVALLFATSGDFWLMFEEWLPAEEQVLPFFILGLGSFLITHLAYCVAFWGFAQRNKSTTTPSGLKALLWVFPLLIVLGCVVFARAQLGEMLLPVLVYGLVVCLMLGLALKLTTRGEYGGWVALGAGLFVISDTLIGCNKFFYSLPLARVFIMLFYLLGQFYIVEGSRRLIK